MKKVCGLQGISTYSSKESLHLKQGMSTQVDKNFYTYVDNLVRISTHTSKNPYTLDGKNAPDKRFNIKRLCIYIHSP